MLIYGELLQSLVDKIIKDIGYNINIIDENGIIVASGSKERIGMFHKAGEEAARLRQRIDISKKNANLYEGVKPGINLPFYYNGCLAGVIGITGEPEQVEDFVKLIRSTIELMFERELLKQKMYIRQTDKAYFIQLLINSQSQINLVEASHLATKLRYAFNLPHIVILIALEGKIKEKKQRETIFIEDEMRQTILKIIKKSNLSTEQDIFAFIARNRIAILKTINVNTLKEQKEEFTLYINELRDNLYKLMQGEIWIAIGNPYNQLEEACESYKEADFLIHQMIEKKIKQHLAYIEEYTLSYLYANLPRVLTDRLLNHYAVLLKDKIELKETMIELSNQNMNLIDTSKALYVHRNTVVTRFNRIKNLLGINSSENVKHHQLFILLGEYLKNME